MNFEESLLGVVGTGVSWAEGDGCWSEWGLLTYFNYE